MTSPLEDVISTMITFGIEEMRSQYGMPETDGFIKVDGTKTGLLVKMPDGRKVSVTVKEIKE